ncbi:hypothetical protein BH11BAC7_BH11BAC7_33030 [soil metagenome]
MLPLQKTNIIISDQLNRLKAARAYKAITLSSNTWNTGAIATAGDYYNSFTYDANGNIITQQRNGIASVAQVEDNLAYNYKLRANGNITSHRTNQLKQVAEDASLLNCSYSDDINKNQDANNYVYDGIGNLIEDKQEYITEIAWTSFGKIKTITKSNNNTTLPKYVDCNGNSVRDAGEPLLVLQDLEFKYNSDWKRICKIVKPHNPAGGVLASTEWIYTYYLRDAPGNVLETYERKQVATVNQFNLKEQDLYGSARLGMIQKTLNLLTAGVPGNAIVRTVGNKTYEMSNHLGNVLTTFSDRRTAVDANADGTVDWFKPVIISASDYAAFGATIPVDLTVPVRIGTGLTVRKMIRRV